MYHLLLSLLLLIPFTVSPMCNPCAWIYAVFSMSYDKMTDASMKQSEAMYTAFMNRDFEQFKILVNNNATFKYKDPQTGKNVLHEIAENNETAYLQFLIDSKKLYSSINSPSFWANERGYANGEIQDKEGKTPLHYAASKGHIKIAQMLIDQQVHLHKSDKKGNIPLFYSLKNQHNSFVKFLKENTDPILWQKCVLNIKITREIQQFILPVAMKTQ